MKYDLNRLTTHQEMEVERKFTRLLESGYIPDGREEEFFRKMLLQKLREINIDGRTG